MTKEIKVSHNGTDITYNEDTSKWEFTLRGRDRSTDSLANAKKAIDSPPPKDSKPFERIEAWMLDRYSNRTAMVTITSQAENNCGNAYFWILSKDGRRSKALDGTLFPVNPKNNALIDEIYEIKADIKVLGEKLDKTVDKLDILKPLPEERE